MPVYVLTWVPQKGILTVACTPYSPTIIPSMQHDYPKPNMSCKSRCRQCHQTEAVGLELLNPKPRRI